MNKRAATLTAQASTDTVREAVLRLMTTTNRTADEDRVLAWNLEEMMNRDADFASFLRNAMGH